MGAPAQITTERAPGQDAVMVERITRSGRHLFYRLEVIQQPERARACGSGPKSSADRRPVDPPPVVELRIFEGARFEEAKDITFNYNANFFLYATLEHARVIAHGRVQTPSANTPPVLTGMPVSGMAYLDRPQEAGYFLFPDLSVRHEGRYRLMFNLYEETKENNDKDREPDVTGGSFDWRMEIKSVDFTVFSAKKFPGLSESTALSRAVADQGCRVRIRRDVRMRRREDKDGKNGDDEFARRRRTQTPETQQKDFRSRSASGSSESRVPYCSKPEAPSRRPSAAEYQSQPAPPPPPGFPSAQSSSLSHLTFGSSYTNQHPQYASQPSSSRQASPVPRSPSYPGPSSGYPSVHTSYPPPPQVQTPTYSERPPSQQYSAYTHPSPQRDTFPSEVRRFSTSSQSARPNTPQSATEHESYRKRSHPTLPLLPQQAPPPPQQQQQQQQMQPEAVGHVAGSGPLKLPSINELISFSPEAAQPSPTYENGHRNSMSIAVDPNPPRAPMPVNAGRKRSHMEANPLTYFTSQESKNGKRPEEAMQPRHLFRAPMEETFLPWEDASGNPKGEIWSCSA